MIDHFFQNRLIKWLSDRNMSVWFEENKQCSDFFLEINTKGFRSVSTTEARTRTSDWLFTGDCFTHACCSVLMSLTGVGTETTYASLFSSLPNNEWAVGTVQWKASCSDLARIFNAQNKWVCLLSVFCLVYVGSVELISLQNKHNFETECLFNLINKK